MGILAGTRINREALKMKRRKRLPEGANVTKHDLYCISIAYNIGNMTGYQVWCFGNLRSRLKVSLGFGYSVRQRELPRWSTRVGLG